jgi:ribosomal protein L11 methyltransferase
LVVVTDKQWIEVSIETNGEIAEAIVDVLLRYGHQGVVIEHTDFEMDAWEDEVTQSDQLVVKAYLPADVHAQDKQQQLRDALRYMNMITPIPEPQFRLMDEENWADAWKKHYRPLRVGRHIYICPEWIDPATIQDLQPNDMLIKLDPGMAFGTGTHPSTQLCLIATEDLLAERPGLSVLDLGCGSGILSIVAVKLNAANVLALDIDELAVTATENNAALNNVSASIQAQTGSLDSLIHAARRFDVILVNILAKVIIAMCEHGLGSVVRPGGYAIFGGIIDDQADDVEDALRQTGLEPYARRYQGDWVVIVARRPH